MQFDKLTELIAKSEKIIRYFFINIGTGKKYKTFM